MTQTHRCVYFDAMTTLNTAPLAPLIDRMFAEAEAPAPSRRVNESPRATSPGGPHPAEREARAGRLPRVLRPRRRTPIWPFRAGGPGCCSCSCARPARGRSWSSAPRSASLPCISRPGSGTTAADGSLPASSSRPRRSGRGRTYAGGLADLIELREGDAVGPSPRPVPEDHVDLVLLDGAKGLYPAVLALLEERLRPGALIVADNADRSPEYLYRVRSAMASTSPCDSRGRGTIDAHPLTL